MSHAYDSKFMQYADTSSKHAARTVAQGLMAKLNISSVLDVGCAKGTWLNAWRELGATDIQGVDGDYIQRQDLLIAQHCFAAHDLSKPLDLQRKFDLVQTLEVAEHINAAAADTFVENLVRHSRGLILFSAAPPGQGGEFHINEQVYDYWRRKFVLFGFDAYDCIRPAIASDTSISFWYRYNMFLYAHRDYAGALPKAIAETRVPEDQPLKDISPSLFRVRKAVIRMLPAGVREQLARLKANFLPSGRW